MTKVEQVKAELEEAIKNADMSRFKAAYDITLTKYWYLTKKERSGYYMRFLEAMHNEKNNTK